MWTLFQEVVYANNYDFTGYVQCTECKWLLRFHGQLTGTSHMRRHKCFMNIHPEIREKYYGGGKNKLPDTSSPQQPAAADVNQYENKESGEDPNTFVQLIDAETNQPLTYYGCTKCASFLKKSEANSVSHQCKQSDLSRNISISGKVIFRQKPQGRAWKQSALWEFFDEVIDAVSNATLIYVRCRRCKQMIRSVDVKGVPSVFRKHEAVCPKKGKVQHVPTVKSETTKPPVQRASIKLTDSCLQFCASELLDPAILARKPFIALVRSVVAHASKMRGRMSRFPNESVLENALAEQTQSLVEQKKLLINSIASDIGGALIYNQRDNLHLLVLAYVDEKWSPVQTVIAAQYDVTQPQQFIHDSLKSLDLKQEKMGNLVLVSREKLGWIHHVLPSSAHEIDEIVESTILSYGSICGLYEACCTILKWNNLEVTFDSNISWIQRLMVFKEVVENESKFNFDQMVDQRLDISLVKLLVTILSPFKEASSELRSCIERSTCNLVFLWYHKLIKILSNFSNSQLSDLANSLREAVQSKLTVGSVHKCATFLWPNFRCLKMLPISSRNDVHQEVRSFLNSSGGENQPIVSKRAKSDFSDWEDVSIEGQDEVDSYIGAVLPSCDEDHLLSWWSEHSSDFPRLSKLARKILAIPASVTYLDKFEIPSKKIDSRLILMHFNS